MQHVIFENVRYTKSALVQIKSSPHIKEGPLSLMKNVILKFCEKAKIRPIDMIALLINKIKRNYKSYGLVNHFINDVIEQQYNYNDLIQYLERRHHVPLSFMYFPAEIIGKSVIIF